MFFLVLVSFAQVPPTRKNIVSEVSLVHCWTGGAAQALVQGVGQGTFGILLVVHLDEEETHVMNFGVSAAGGWTGQGVPLGSGMTRVCLSLGVQTRMFGSQILDGGKVEEHLQVPLDCVDQEGPDSDRTLAHDLGAGVGVC